MSTSRRSITLNASEQRLRKLVLERLAPGADQRAIDERIWDLFGEAWCVMFTDLSGFSRDAAKFGIIHFLQTIFESERLLIPVIERHDGILLKVEGDSLLVIYRNVGKALRAALEMQRLLARYNTDRAAEDRVLLGIGLGFGRMLRIGDADVYGVEVNAASKLGEDAAEPYEVLVTQAVRDHARESPEFAFEAIDRAIPGGGQAFRLNYVL